MSTEEAFCNVPEELQAKYSVPPNGSQTIVEVRNKLSLDTMVYNSERGRKPQTFKEEFSADNLIEAANYLDSSRGDVNRCDFCRHEHPIITLVGSSRSDESREKGFDASGFVLDCLWL